MCSWCLVFLIDQSKLDEIGKQAAGMGALDRNKSTDSAIIAQLMSCYLSYWASYLKLEQTPRGLSSIIPSMQMRMYARTSSVRQDEHAPTMDDWLDGAAGKMLDKPESGEPPSVDSQERVTVRMGSRAAMVKASRLSVPMEDLW